MTRSGYYAWRQRQEAPGKRAADFPTGRLQIQAVFHEHRGFYGSPRIHQGLRACRPSGGPPSCRPAHAAG